MNKFFEVIRIINEKFQAIPSMVMFCFAILCTILLVIAGVLISMGGLSHERMVLLWLSVLIIISSVWGSYTHSKDQKKSRIPKKELKDIAFDIEKDWEDL